MSHHNHTNYPSFYHGGEPVAVVQGPHRGVWGYVDANDGTHIRVLLAHLPADHAVTVLPSELSHIKFTD